MRFAFFARPDMPMLLLRAGLAIVLAYAAVSSLVTPEDWVGYLPDFARSVVDANLLLGVFSVYQLGLVVWLASGWRLELAGLACAATFAGIVAANTALLPITFRDIALTFAALALASLSLQARKQHKH
ncbi:MAG: hypothetical protein ACREGD_03295 [Candidatus Saccharimonadales bacterium]